MIILKLNLCSAKKPLRRILGRIALVEDQRKLTLQIDPEILRLLGLGEFVCLDFETTGLEAESAEIIEIGAVRVKDGQAVEKFERLVGIVGELPEAITHLTGIRPEDLQGRPPIDEVLPELLDFLSSSRIIAHNLPFDFSFLQAALSRGGFAVRVPDFNPENPRHLDLLPLTRIVFPRLRAYNLESLAAQFGLDVWDRHRALADVFAEVQLLERLLLGALALPDAALEHLLLLAPQCSRALEDLFRKIVSVRRTKAHGISPGAAELREAVQPISPNILPRRFPRPDESEAFEHEEVLRVFEPDGELARDLSAYEYRDEQVDMAEAVCRAYSQSAFLTVEAGTGTGKSWAYLVPAVYWSQAHPLPAARTVVSTNTKNLQEQIFHKDLPFLHGNLKADFQAVLLKGRNNYLCLDRWEEFWRSVDFAVEPHEAEAAMALAVWQAETATGDVEEASGFQVSRNARLWSKLRSDGYACKGNVCPFKDRCYVQRVRQAAKVADIVVVNHSLLLSDLGAQHKILGEYTNLIIDEAHNFENAATEHLGREWSQWTLRNPLQGMLGRGEGRGTPLAGIPLVLDRTRSAGREEILRIFQSAARQAERLLEANSTFFDRVAQLVLADSVTARGYARKIRFKNWLEEFPNLEEYSRELDRHFRALLERLEQLLGMLDGFSLRGIPDDLKSGWEQALALLQGLYEELAVAKDTVRRLLFESGEEDVRWIEPAGGRGSAEVRFRLAPLDVAPLLEKHLYQRLQTAVFTSATLSVAGSFDYFNRRLGIDRIAPERRLEKILGSPFEYREQVRVLIPRFLPDPKHPKFVPRGSELLFEALRAARRSALVLFTSYQMLDQVYEGIRQRLREEDLAVVAQGRSGSRNNLLRMLREGQAKVLLGTQSFWEGVDLPGEALEMLVITKLPFEVPSEPVVQARMEQIERNGGNSFYQYTVPNAVLRFRQGFGRLIRSREDRGVVLLLDARIVSTRYGALFYQSLPVEPEVIPSLDELLERIVDWFS